MQPVVVDPRTGAASEVERIIRDHGAVVVGRSLEVLDKDLNVIDTVDELEDGSVRRNMFADNHGTASLKVGRELDWGADIVRPVVTLGDGVSSFAFRLGAYYVNTPKQSFARRPATWDVEAVDILDGLRGGMGDTYTLAAGTPVLEQVESLVVEAGYTQYVIDPSAVDAVVQPPGFTRPITDAPSRRGIINDLLSIVGYAGIWSDWDGRLRMQPYQRPADRDLEWTYTDDAHTGMIQTEREMEDDFHDVPNQWTFYRNNAEEGQTLSPGNGIYTFTNWSVGRSSVDARRRTIAAPPEGLEATSQAALEAAAQAKIDADMSLVRRIAAATDLNPLHWHADVVWVSDVAMGQPFRAQVTEWTFPLRGRAMAQNWTVVE